MECLPWNASRGVPWSAVIAVESPWSRRGVAVESPWSAVEHRGVPVLWSARGVPVEFLRCVPMEICAGADATVVALGGIVVSKNPA